MHTSVKRATACLIFTLTLGLIACGQKEDFALKEYAPKSAKASIKNVSLSTSDSNKFDPQRVATQFPAGTKKVLVWYRWEDGDKDKKVDIHWSMGSTSLLKQGEALGGKSGTAAWIMQLGAGGDLPSGNYKVELLENGSVVTAIPFRVGSAVSVAPVASLASVASAAPTPVAEAPLATIATAPASMAQPPASVAKAEAPQPPDAPVPTAQPSAAIAQAPTPKALDAPVPMAQPAAVAATPAAPAVLASADGEKAGVRVVVTELKRSSGDTVNLKFVLINDSDEKLTLSSSYLGAGTGPDYKSVGGVHLVEPVGKKKYLVVRDAQGNCLCSTNIEDSRPKTRVNLWAKFPAPPAGVQKISIVIPHFSPMDDVPISQ